MKRKVLILLITVLSLSTILFAGLYMREKHDQSDLTRLAQSGINESAEWFNQYLEGGGEECYWYGVSGFYTYMQSYCLLKNDPADPDYQLCRKLYGGLVLYPEHAQEHIYDLVVAVELLSAGLDNPNGFIQVSNLTNAIFHA